MLLNIHIEESLRIRNKKISSEWLFNALLQCAQRLHNMSIFVLVIVLLLHSSAFWDKNSYKTDSSSAPRIRRNIMSNSVTHENLITVTCFLIGQLVGAWRILVIGRKQGDIMYATLNVWYNGYKL
jgi:hypothetical protein